MLTMPTMSMSTMWFLGRLLLSKLVGRTDQCTSIFKQMIIDIAYFCSQEEVHKLWMITTHHPLFGCLAPHNCHQYGRLQLVLPKFDRWSQRSLRRLRAASGNRWMEGEGGIGPGRFPCFVLWHLSWIIVMIKSQLSRAINYSYKVFSLIDPPHFLDWIGNNLQPNGSFLSWRILWPSALVRCQDFSFSVRN